MLGDLIRARRAQLGLTTRELADQVGVSHGYLSRLERNLIAQPALSILQRLSRALRLELQALLNAGGIAQQYQDLVHVGQESAELGAALANDTRFLELARAWVNLDQDGREWLAKAATYWSEMQTRIQALEENTGQEE